MNKKSCNLSRNIKLGWKEAEYYKFVFPGRISLNSYNLVFPELFSLLLQVDWSSVLMLLCRAVGSSNRCAVLWLDGLESGDLLSPILRPVWSQAKPVLPG